MSYSAAGTALGAVTPGRSGESSTPLFSPVNGGPEPSPRSHRGVPGAREQGAARPDGGWGRVRKRERSRLIRARGGSGSAWVLEAVVGEVWASTEERVGVTYAEGLPGPRAAGAEGGTGTARQTGQEALRLLTPHRRGSWARGGDSEGGDKWPDPGYTLKGGAARVSGETVSRLFLSGHHGRPRTGGSRWRGERLGLALSRARAKTRV